MCHTGIFPASNLVSPVADQVRKKLSTVTWATRLPILSTNEVIIHQDKQQSLTETEKNGYVIVNPTAGGGGGASGLSHHPHRAIDMTQESTVFTTKVCFLILWKSLLINLVRRKRSRR
jgi:hypothetical protein